MFLKEGIVCRLCLLSGLNINFFEEIAGNPKDKPICLKIYCALKWEVSREDNLPNHVCNDCMQKLDFIVWCNAWSSKVHTFFSQVRSLLDLYCCQSNETAKKTLLSLFQERNAKNTASDNGVKFSRVRALMSELDSIFSECELADTGSNSSEDSSIDLLNCSLKEKSVVPKEISENCGQKNLDCFCSNCTAGSDGINNPNNAQCFRGGCNSKEALKLVTVQDKEEIQQVLTNSDSERTDDPTCEASTNFGNSFESEMGASLRLDGENSEAPCSLRFSCPECKEIFSRKSHLLKHLMCHEGATDKYQCSVCKRKFISTSELNRHSRAHMGLKPYSCVKCDRFFSQKNLLENHMNWHEGRKSHLCDVCGEYLSSGSNLKTHKQNLHAAEKKKPFDCKECGKSFSRNHHLENHITIHGESRPHQCAICGVTFKRSSQLSEHEHVHSSEKRFTCNQCNKVFRTKRVLNVHKLVHSDLKPHQCTLCTKSFVRRGGLLAHLKTHSS